MADTIFARSSGEGRAGIAVWRISGEGARSVLETLAGGVPTPRRAAWRKIADPDGGILDDGIVLFFPGPASATGEDVAEFHLHGSIAVGDRFAAILTTLGLRPATPGEFSYRAMSNGQMDLLAVEALGDLLDAETETQRQQAVGAAEAGGRMVEGWRTSLTEALSTLDAAVDFPDEEDIPEDIAARCLPRLRAVHAEMAEALRGALAGERLRRGVDVVILGPPNAGKSSFLNRLAGEDRAIVSDVPGTTRDVVSARLDIGGRLVNVLDTAGLRETSDDPIELIGMERSRAAAAAADLVIWLEDLTDPASAPPRGLGPKVFHVKNKLDEGPATPGGHAVSIHTGEGLPELLSALEAEIAALATPAALPRERHRQLVGLAADRLAAILENPSPVPEVLAEDIRHTLSQLDQLIGKVTADDVLGAIFSSFCIGK